MPTEPYGEDVQERMVLVGTRYHSINNSWAEWSEQSFEDVIAQVAERAKDQTVNHYPSEVVEVIVVRKARVSAEVTVSEVVPSGDKEADR